MERQRCNQCCWPRVERGPRRVRLQNGRRLLASRKRWIWKFSFRPDRQQTHALCKPCTVRDYSARCSSIVTIETSRDADRLPPGTCRLDRAALGAKRKLLCVKRRCRSKHRSYHCALLFRVEDQALERDRHRSIQTKYSRPARQPGRRAFG